MKLKKFRIGNVSDIMSDKMLKSIIGGYDLPEIYIYAEGTCAWYGKLNGVGPEVPRCGISKNAAMGYHEASGGNWCCDSCSTTQWYLDYC